MARTEDDLSNMSPIEKVKLLKQKEEARKKELKGLEEKKKKEIEDIESQLVNAVREIRDEDEEHFKKEEQKKRKETERERSLEESVEEEAPRGNATQSQGNSTYISDALTTPGANVNLYDVTNYNVYNRVKELVQKADSGFISDQERNFLSTVSYHIDRMRREDMYKSSDSSGYLGRTSSLLEKLDKDLARY